MSVPLPALTSFLKPTSRRVWLSVCAIVVFELLLPTILRAQETEKSPPFISLTGSWTLTSDFYYAKATPDSAQPARRPPGLHRIIFTPTISFGEFLSLPFNITFTAPETNTNTPSTEHPTLIQYLENPANSLGFSSISPNFGWAKFNLGSFTPQHSALTAGDQQLFGGGFDITPGYFQVASSAGVIQRAIEPDSVHEGRYRRDMYTARLGYGKVDSSHVGLNMVYIKDVIPSLHNNILSIDPEYPSEDTPTVIIPADTSRLLAEEGIVASTDFGLILADGISFNAEGAASLFTRDQRAEAKSIPGNPLKGLLTTRMSTRLDFAGNAALKIREREWGIALSGLYLGAGYMPLGYPFMQADRLEWTVGPEVHLFDGTFNVRGSLGERVNNLSGTKGETMTQLIGSGSMSADLSQEFNLSASFTNCAVRNDKRSDTLKVQNVTRAISIDPTLTLQRESVTHTLTASAQLDDYIDYNTITGAESPNKTRTASFGYTVAFSGFPLTVGTVASYIENVLPSARSIIRSAGLNAGYAFAEGKLLPSFSLTRSGNTNAAGSTDAQLFLKLIVQWDVTPQFSITATAGNDHYNYGYPSSQGDAFHERMLQLAITNRF